MLYFKKKNLKNLISIKLYFNLIFFILKLLNHFSNSNIKSETF